MTLLRLAGPRTFAALMLMITGGSAASLQAAPSYTQAYPQTATPSVAQYPQYTQYPQTNVTVPPVQPQTSPYAVTTQPVQQQIAQQPMMQQAVQPTMSQAPAGGYRVAQNPVSTYQTPTYQMPNYQAPAPGQRFAMNEPTAAAPTPEAVPAPPGTLAPHIAPAQYPENYSNQPQPAGYSSYPATEQQGGWEGYVQAPGQAYQGAGCQTGTCGTEECDPGMSGYLKGHLTNACCGRQWFFGAYALYMTRDNPSYHKFAAQVDMPMPNPYPYYPTQSDIILSTNDIKPDWQWGAEVRLGSTFGRSCDPCGCGPRPYAWELVYWGLAEDDQSALRTDMLGDADRIYGQINYAGLQYTMDGMPTNNRPLNDYMDYGMPIEDPTSMPDDVRVLAVRARSYFSMQNLELNFIRFPVAGCGYDPCCPPRFTVNGLAGVRFLKIDDNFDYADFTTVGGDPGTGWAPDPGMPSTYPGGFPSDEPNSIFHEVRVDNQLVGFQLGANMNWLIGCKWSAFCDTQFGIYGNNIDSYQRVYGGGDGVVSWVNSGNEVVVNSDKTDVSFLTEVRAGFGYQVGCNCRITAAYRLMALTGVALSGEQMSTDWSDPAYVGMIDSNDSLILHGLQTGVEWKY